MDGRVLKKDSRCYVELPPEFLNCERVELFPLKSGYYLLTVPLGENRAQTMPLPAVGRLSLPEEEKAILHKLLAIRFDQRIPSRVEKLLNDREKQLLRTLLEKEYVNQFKSRKYPEGVYNISDRVYPLLAGSTHGYGVGGMGYAVGARRTLPKAQGLNSIPSSTTPTLSPSIPKPTAQGPRPSPSPDPLVSLASDGYVVIEDARIAAQISEQLRRQGKSNNVRGIKGFDGKFYAVTKTFFSKASPLILKSLEEPRDSESISKTCKLPPAACRAVLQLLSEDGDVLEKRKGIFVRA